MTMPTSHSTCGSVKSCASLISLLGTRRGMVTYVRLLKLTRCWPEKGILQSSWELVIVGGVVPRTANLCGVQNVSRFTTVPRTVSVQIGGRTERLAKNSQIR